MGLAPSKQGASPALAPVDSYTPSQHARPATNVGETISAPSPIGASPVTALEPPAPKEGIDLSALRATAFSSRSTPSPAPLPLSTSPTVPNSITDRVTPTGETQKDRTVDKMEKEEGEISDEEEEGLIGREDSLNSSYRSSAPASLPPRPLQSSHSAIPSSYPAQRSPTFPSGPSRVALLREDAFRPGPSRKSPGPLAAAPTNISPEEAKQYTDIIRNLLYDGFSPESLIRRGATAKYVTAVCEEIVEGTKRRQALWLEPRESRNRVDSEAPLTIPIPPVAGIRSPSPDVEVSVKMTRGHSISSETSIDIGLSDPSSLSPPQPILPAIVPHSSWQPATQPSIMRREPPRSPAAMRVETYKPGQPSTVTLPPLQSSVPSSQALPRPRPVQTYIPSGPRSLVARTARPPTLPAKPIVSKGKSPGKKKRNRDAADPVSPTILNYDDADQALPPVQLVREQLPPVPIVVTEGVASTTAVTPTSEPANNVDAATAFQQALQETRRRALESMKLKRSLQTGRPVAIPSNSTPQPEVPVMMPVVAEGKSLEEEMADLEKEVLELRAEAGEAPMDIDEPEEGEITPSNETETLPELPIPILAPIPVRPSRGHKRPNADDLNNRPTSAPLRTIPPFKRRQFGGNPQRPNRLLVNLDDNSDSDSDEEPVSIAASTPALPAIDPIEAQRILAEKEENIRMLREQIAERLKARIMARNSSQDNATPLPDEVRPPSVAAAIAQDVEMGSSAPDTLHASGVQAKETGTEAAMEVDLDPSPQSAPLPSVSLTEHALDVQPSRSVSPSIIQLASVPSTKESNFAHKFSSYRPLLSRYPQLAAATTASLLPYAANNPLSHQTPRLAPIPEAISSLSSVDEALLASIVLTRRLQRQSDAVMCRAESGGGQCADTTCQDLHLAKDLQPTDADLIEYVSQVWPSPKERSTISSAVIGAKLALNFGSGSGNSNRSNKSKKKGKAMATEVTGGTGSGTAISQEMRLALFNKVGQILRGT